MNQAIQCVKTQLPPGWILGAANNRMQLVSPKGQSFLFFIDNDKLIAESLNRVIEIAGVGE
jgi:hypothetical protein